MLPLARYRFYFKALTPVHFPEWAGSVLRGGFGHALRRLACMTRQSECTGCPLLHTCPYPMLFAPPAVEHSLHRLSQPPAPYLIEPAGWGVSELASGDTWHLDMVLMGRALNELPLISMAWQRAARHGLGPGHGRSDLVRIDYLPPGGEVLPVMDGPGHALASHTVTAPPVDAVFSERVCLRFVTPLRLQNNGRALSADKLDAERLLMTLVRRLGLLFEFYGQGAPDWNFPVLKQAAKSIRGRKDLVWKDWTRRSARQQQTMQLGGVIGTWELEGDLVPFLPALVLGQWVHVGKETVFGLGRYDVVE